IRTPFRCYSFVDFSRRTFTVMFSNFLLLRTPHQHFNSFCSLRLSLFSRAQYPFPRQSVLRRQKHSYFHHFIIRMVAPCEDTLMSQTASARNTSQPLSSVLTHPQLGHSTRRSFAR